MLVFTRQERKILSIVLVFHLVGKLPSYSSLFSLSCFSHNLVYSNDKQETRHNTSLSYSSLDSEPIRCLHVVNDTASYTVVPSPDDGNKEIRNSIWLQNLPKLVSMYTVKGFLKVYEFYVQRWLPLYALFNNISKNEDLFVCPLSHSIRFQLISQFVLYHLY